MPCPYGILGVATQQEPPTGRALDRCTLPARRGARIETGGVGVVARVGLYALGRFADALGFGAALSARIVPAGERFPFPDRGKVLVHAMLTLAAGGDASPPRSARSNTDGPGPADHKPMARSNDSTAPWPTSGPTPAPTPQTTSAPAPLTASSTPSGHERRHGGPNLTYAVIR